MYKLKDLVMISGLTERTLRNYLKKGVLKGEKNNGVWVFTHEQIERFLEDPFVKPAIKASKMTVIKDYLNDVYQKNTTACLVLHLPKEKPKELSTFFCEVANNSHGLTMNYEKDGSCNRVILVGEIESVYLAFNKYFLRWSNGTTVADQKNHK